MSKLAFRKQALGPFFFLFLLRRLPLAYLAGVKLNRLNDEGSITSIKFKWLNQNPFRSIYFAAMHMAAEFSTGSLLFQYIDKKTSFSMLLVETEAQFHKKAIGKIVFSCNKGPEADSFVQEVLKISEGATITLPVEASNENGDLVATFQYTWSCRSK